MSIEIGSISGADFIKMLKEAKEDNDKGRVSYLFDPSRSPTHKVITDVIKPRLLARLQANSPLSMSNLDDIKTGKKMELTVREHNEKLKESSIYSILKYNSGLHVTVIHQEINRVAGISEEDKYNAVANQIDYVIDILEEVNKNLITYRHVTPTINITFTQINDEGYSGIKVSFAEIEHANNTGDISYLIGPDRLDVEAVKDILVNVITSTIKLSYMY